MAKPNSIRKRIINAMLVAVVVLAWVLIPPTMAVTVDNFVITPASNVVGVTSAYTIQTNTTNFTSLNITISKAFSADTPQAGDLIAEVDLWWDNPTPYYGYINFTANATSPETKLDVYADIGGGIATLEGMATNYSEGGVTSVLSPFGTQEERANLTLPTLTIGGWMNISGLPDNITNITVTIGEFVNNPTTQGDYAFSADGTAENVYIASAYNITLLTGSNIIGWTDTTPTTSTGLCTNIGANCTWVYDLSAAGTYTSKHCGYPGGDFDVNRGWGYETLISAETVWGRES